MSWEEVQETQSSGGFMKLAQGDNKVRIVSEPHVRWTHWINNQSLPCTQKEQKCITCTKDTAKVRYSFHVIDRKDGQLKILDTGASIAGALKKLKYSEDYGFESVPEYDVTINRSGEGMNTEYNVMPARNNTPLTEEEKTAIEALNPLSRVFEKIEAKKETSYEEEIPPPADNSDIRLSEIPY